jgi:hypothetical protein
MLAVLAVPSGFITVSVLLCSFENPAGTLCQGMHDHNIRSSSSESDLKFLLTLSL